MERNKVKELPSEAAVFSVEVAELLNMRTKLSELHIF